MFRPIPFLIFAVLCLLVSFPSLVHAEMALPAGFAAAPLWISNASPIDGDALKLFAVVNNASPATVSGTVSFLVDEMTVGSVKVSLAAGTAQILSVQWTAATGAHSITATFLGTLAGPLTITVAAAPPKPVALQYLDTAVNAVGSVAGPAFSGTLAKIENIRKSGANYFAEQSDLDTASTAHIGTSTVPQGQILGAKTESRTYAPPVAAAATGFSSLINRLGYSVFINPILFYPAFLLFFFFVLWIILRIFSRN